MDIIKVVTFPYASEPIIQEIENNKYSFIQIVEGKLLDIRINKYLMLIMNKHSDEDYKYQEQHKIYGNFIVMNVKSDGTITSMPEDLAESVAEDLGRFMEKDIEEYIEEKMKLIGFCKKELRFID